MTMTENTPGPAGPEIAAAYASAYDGDLRIFLHQLCEISAILGLPYDGHFDMQLQSGSFQWREGAVTLLASPGERTVLLIDIAKVPKVPTGEGGPARVGRALPHARQASLTAEDAGLSCNSSGAIGSAIGIITAPHLIAKRLKSLGFWGSQAGDTQR
jgi:hypothetical protein